MENKRPSGVLVVTIVLTMIFSSHGMAATVDFSGVSAGIYDTLTIADFTFVGIEIVDLGSGDMALQTGSNPFGDLSSYVRRNDYQVFNIESLQGSGLIAGSPATVQFSLGYYLPGGEIPGDGLDNNLDGVYDNPSAQDNYTTDASGIMMSYLAGNQDDFTYLSFGPTDTSANPLLTLDNLVFTTNATVPVPAAVWLLVTGLIGIIGIRRKIGK